MRTALMIAALLCAAPATAQPIGFGNTEPRADRREPASPLLGEVFTNEDLAADTPFVLLLIHDGGSTVTQRLGAMLSRPQSPELLEWSRVATFQTIDGRSAEAAEKHGWLLAKYRGRLPIVALVQMQGTGPGAVWWDAGGEYLPTDELALAARLSDAYQRTIKAAEEQTPRPADRLRNTGPRARDGLDVHSLGGRDREPWINPRVDVTVPDSVDTNVNAGLDEVSRDSIKFGGMVLGGAFFGGCTVLGLCIIGGLIGSAVLRGFADTGPPDDKIVRRRRRQPTNPNTPAGNGQ